MAGTMGLLEEGQVIHGAYEVEWLVGEGAFAQVYLVKHKFLGRQAMKVFKMSVMTIEETRPLLQEAILLSQIRHRNIVQLHDAGTVETSSGERAFYTMEYVAGGSLERFWQSHGNRLVSIETAVDILKQVCSGLAVAHAGEPPIVHRDIKPQNILVGYDMAGLRALVSDFGLAKRVNTLTLLATARGTLQFKPPEVFRDPGSDSCAGDVWALGCTLYLLLTDRLPYDVEGDRGFDRPLRPASHFNVLVDAALDSILARTLAKDPKRRYPDAAALLPELDRWKPRPPGAAPSPEPWQPDEKKVALGPHTPADEEAGRADAARAKNLARQLGKLNEAADLMEGAFNKCPGLRDDYGYWVRLWREGKRM